jgi:hypothetical protein
VFIELGISVAQLRDAVTAQLQIARADPTSSAS